MGLADTELALVEGHHEVFCEQKTGEEIHIFAIAGAPVFGDAERKMSRYDFKIEFPIGPVVFILEGYVDLSSLEISATFSVRIPILGTYQLGKVVGNLKDGVVLKFGISGIITGEARFYLKDKYLWVDLTATILGTKYGPYSIRLIPIPF